MTTKTEEVKEITIYKPDSAKLSNLEKMTPAFALNKKYKTMDEWATLLNKPIRAYFMGLQELPNEDGEMITCGAFVTADEVFLSGQMILIEAVKNLEIETPLEITYRGKKKNKSSNGNTMLFDVSILQ